MNITTATSPTDSDAVAFPPFSTRWPWWSGDLQTVRNTLVRRRSKLAALPSEILRFPMEDGTGDTLVGILTRPREDSGERPLVMLVHGLTGSADSPYMTATAFALVERGHPVLRLNARGAGPTRAHCTSLYHAGRTEDLRRVIAALPDALRRNGVVPVGYSLGGNTVLKLLGEGAPPDVRGGVSVSAPIDLRRACLRMMRPRNLLYHRWLLSAMKAEALAGPLAPGEAGTVRAVRSIWEFDDRFVAPRNGWSGAEEYYAVNSAAGFLDGIRVPTLLVHALDDPWIPGGMYAERDWSANPNLVPLLPRRGGHVGFHGPGTEGWLDQCIGLFLSRFRSEAGTPPEGR